MARTKTETVDTSIVITDAETPGLPAMSEALHQLDVAQHQHEVTVRAIATQMGYQLPADSIDADLIQRDISANMRRSVEACLEVGRGLTVLKAACEHGNYMARLDVIGLDVYVAARFMQAARKFSKLPTSATLTKAISNQSKLFEMLVLDDEQIEELELTGKTGELSLDDVATMSVKELRAALRKAKQDAEAVDRVLADKNTAIDKLAVQLNSKEQLVAQRTPDEIAKELRSQAVVDGFAAEHAIQHRLGTTFKALIEHSLDNGGDHKQFMLGLVVQIELELTKVRQEFNLQGEISTDDTPDWMKPSAMDDAEKISAEWAEKLASPEWAGHPAAKAISNNNEPVN